MESPRPSASNSPACAATGDGEMDLAKFMGWSTLAMAQRYTRHEDQERALRAHREHSPLDSF